MNARKMCDGCGERNPGHEDHVEILKGGQRIWVSVEMFGNGSGNGTAVSCHLSC